VESNPLTAVLVTGPAHGTLTLNANGSFSYTPAANYNGSDSFTYKANDGSADSNVATVTITIISVNDAPVAANDSYGTDEDTALNIPAPGVLGNDSDVDGDSLTAILVSGPSHGTLTLNSDGSFSYTPAANYNGPDSFEYKANDSSLDSNTATVSLTINAINDAPIALNNSYSTDEDTALIISTPGVLGNDTDVDGDILTAALVAGPAHGTLTLNSDGSFTYTSAANYNGSDSFTYKANDGSLDSNVATVSLTINAVNDAPVLDPIGNKTVNEETLLSFTAAASDIDVPADTLTFSLVGAPAGAGIDGNTGDFNWTPSEAQGSGDYTFAIKVCDNGTPSLCDTEEITVHVDEVNVAPVLDPIGNKAVNEETALTFIASASDHDIPANTLTFGLVDAPAGASINSSTGAFSWTPTEAQGPGTYTFDVCVSDGALSDCETIEVIVNEVNVAPVLSSIGNKSVDEETELSFSASATDHDLPANALSFSLVDAPAGASINSSTGAFSWTPTEAEGPSDYTFTVKVCDDGVGTLCDEEAITVHVNEVNVAPVLAAIGNKIVNEETQLSFTASATDVDLPANNLTFSLVGAPAGASIDSGSGAFAWMPTEAQGPGDYTFTVKVCDNGTPSLCDQESITVHVDEVNVAPVLDPIGNKTIDEETLLSFAASASDHDLPANTLSFSLVGAPAGASIDGSTGAFSWTPTEAQGPGVYSFDVCVSDGALEDCETIEVTVNEVNVAPVLASIGDKSIAEETELAFTASASDHDIPANTLTFSLVGAPAGASIASSGAFSWTPTEAQGPGTYTFDVCVSDGALSDCENIKVTVSEVNVAPVLSAIGNKSIDEGSLLSFTASASDHDIPANTLTYSLVGAPAGAGINSSSGVFTWTPSEAQGPGTYTFDVCVSDGALNDCETITVTVAEVNVAPVLGAIGSKTVNEGSTLSFTATATDADLPANTLSFSLVGAPAGASINSGSGAFSWTPADNGVFTFAVKVCDNGSPVLCDDETITVTVNNVAPIVGTLTLTGASGQACIAGNSVSLSFGFTDAGINDNPWAVDVNWGDGNHTIYNAASQGAQAALTHSYGAGTFTISVKVTDKDGSNGTNASSTGAISHLYNMSGILAPFNPDGTSVWKYGSTLPVKVKITDCSGNPVSGLAPKIGTSLVSSTDPNLTIDETASTSGADTTGVMRYDPTAGQYIYNFASKNLSDPSATYYMTVKGTDASGNIVTSPAMVQVKFGLKTK
jgi:VCBS repeat-containing protein